MMELQNQVTRIDFAEFHWLDISGPTPEKLQELSYTYGMHATSVQDCMQPEHLPKVEMIGDVGFVILRAFDQDCGKSSDTVQELTRKVAVFYSPRFVLTIHRVEPPWLKGLMEKWRGMAATSKVRPQSILADLLWEVTRSYRAPVMTCLQDLEQFEAEIFGAGTQRKFHLPKGYFLKRKISVFRRMLRVTLEPVNKIMAGATSAELPDFQNIREQIDALYFYADEVYESIGSLLNLYVSLSSQKTNEASRRINEVMRVLTIFSCFFLPMNFIASVYGMNFHNMPELQWKYGYYFSLALMAFVSLTIFFWFLRRGWLKRSDLG